MPTNYPWYKLRPANITANESAPSTAANGQVRLTSVPGIWQLNKGVAGQDLISMKRAIGLRIRCGATADYTGTAVVKAWTYSPEALFPGGQDSNCYHSLYLGAITFTWTTGNTLTPGVGTSGLGLDFADTSAISEAVGFTSAWVWGTSRTSTSYAGNDYSGAPTNTPAELFIPNTLGDEFIVFRMTTIPSSAAGQIWFKPVCLTEEQDGSSGHG